MAPKHPDIHLRIAMLIERSRDLQERSRAAREAAAAAVFRAEIVAGTGRATVVDLAEYRKQRKTA